MTPQEKAQAWKNLKQMVSKVFDPTLRTMMMAEFRQRAIADWGFDPETSVPTKSQQVELDDWEKALVQDIKDYKDYGMVQETQLELLFNGVVMSMQDLVSMNLGSM